MSVDPVQEQVRLYAKQLKLPTFVRYPDILRKGRPDARFEELLLELMKAETEQRQENQNRKRLRAATNLPFSQWTELFENTAMVAALVDRLTFKSYVLDMNGDSYRLDQTLKAQHS